MMDNLKKLIDVKSLVTLSLTVLFIVLAIRGVIPGEVMTIYTVVISFYFGTQASKAAATSATANVENTTEEGASSSGDTK
jgi:hypothetical protein